MVSVEYVIGEDVEEFKNHRCGICGQPIGKKKFCAHASTDRKQVVFAAHLRCLVKVREELKAYLRKTTELMEKSAKRGWKHNCLYLAGMKHALEIVLREGPYKNKKWKIK